MPETNTIRRIKSITEFHRWKGLPAPEHPLVSVINFADIENSEEEKQMSYVQDFYSISLKRNVTGKFKYGQQNYDFDEGIMFFVSPNQVFQYLAAAAPKKKLSGWLLLIHPDFLWNTPLAKGIKKYEYFDYAVHEALFLSTKEEKLLLSILAQIQQEYHANTDAYSQSIIISQIETFLNYAERFYQRQFITRKKAAHQILEQLESFLANYFASEETSTKGIPTVQYTAESLNISPSYLSSLLKSLTGQSTQQHIHEALIAKAKEKLSTTALTVSEIAYELGFEHPQSLSKLFKSKTKLSPLAFRQSFGS